MHLLGSTSSLETRSVVNWSKRQEKHLNDVSLTKEMEKEVDDDHADGICEEAAIETQG